MSSSVCTSELYTLRFHFLDHLVEDFRSLKNILVLAVFVNEQVNERINNTYRGYSLKRATHMTKRTVMM